MFFRREKPRTITFDDRVSRLKDAGFTVQSLGSGKARITKHGCVSTIEDQGAEPPLASGLGVAIGNEVGVLTHGGYQQFFVTPSGKRLPALAQQLRALHDFQEDLKEAVGLISFYNQGLGTTSEQHRYDRLQNRSVNGSPAPTH